MTTTPNPYGPHGMYSNPDPEPVKKPLWKRAWPVYGYAAAGIFLLALIGGGGGDTVTAPAVTTTATVTAESTVTAEAEPAPAAAAVTEVPDVCIAALDDADDFRVITQDLTTIVAQHMSDEGDAWIAMSEDDYTFVDTYMGKIEKLNTDVEGLTSRVLANDYGINAEVCRASR